MLVSLGVVCVLCLFSSVSSHELSHNQLLVHTVLCQELTVCPLFHHTPLLYHYHLYNRTHTTMKPNLVHIPLTEIGVHLERDKLKTNFFLA